MDGINFFYFKCAALTFNEIKAFLSLLFTLEFFAIPVFPSPNLKPYDVYYVI